MPRSLFRLFPGAVSAVLLSATLASAQHPANRIAQEIDSGIATQLPGSLNPRIAAARDIGRLNASAPIEGITLWFQPTPEQKAELDALVEAQQTPGSPLYHAWLTPAQYASRFGLSDADLARVQNWLESQGFNIDRVANSRTSITFSGTAAQVESAFQTQLHHYQVGAETHFANATDLAIPAALSGVVRAVGNLNDFRPAPHVRRSTLQPSFTSSQSGAHYLSPKDVGTIYDINAAWNAGYTGSGVTIVVVGQTAIVPADISAFQTAAGLTVKAPTITLVPNSGTSTVVQGDEAESDLDVEYAGGIARDATINFIYTGNAQNKGVFDALAYAVDNRIGSIINISYGACEPNVSAGAFSQLEGIMEQAATQGQTVVASSGDSGSTACYAPTGNTVTPAMKVLAVNYPASSAYAVGVGGTEFTDVTSSTHWQSASGSDVISSALSYIPETTWNDDPITAQFGAQDALSAAGGGISTLAARPSWQTGVPGIPSGSFRLVPDVSLASSPNYAGYLYCTSDQSSWNKGNGQAASCNAGFRDSSTQDLTIAGGTSFAAPIFSGMLAIITQKQGGSGLGVANRTLYTLAANSSTYASAFHDITTGGNQCTAGASFCSSSGSAQYAAAAGYDEATGLGSVDFNNLMTAWAGTSGGGSGGGTGSASFALSATSASATRGSSTTSTVQVTPQNSYAGTVHFSATSTGSLLTYGCYTISDTAVTGGTTNATLTIYTSQSACSTTSGVHAFTAHGNPGVTTSRNNAPFGKSIPLGAAAFAGLLFVGFRKSRKAWTLFSCLAVAAMLGFASGCGSQSSNSTTSNSTASTNNQVSTGSYIVTVVGADTTTSGITASTTLTLTVN
ncbi:MAG TPA: S53 family peptidase [Acidobacteriaceae bacterium]|nr:S53 family peptidase [Acidobacteriaceae bacterium]